MTMVNRSPLAASIWNLRPTPGRFASLMVDITLRFASQKGSFPFLFEFALAELADVKLSGPLARIDGPPMAMRTSPRRFHDPVGGHRRVRVHSSSMTDHSPCPRLRKEILKDIWASSYWLKQSGEERDPVKAKGRYVSGYPQDCSAANMMS